MWDTVIDDGMLIRAIRTEFAEVIPDCHLRDDSCQAILLFKKACRLFRPFIMVMV